MTEETNLGPITVVRKSGAEVFHDGGRALTESISDFWSWSYSDLVSNTSRGVIAEYIVAMALGITDGVRDEWAPHDLTTKDGVRIQVKSAAYVQSWHQNKYSNISFSIRKSGTWDPRTGRFDPELKRHADVYVFALLARKDKSTIDPMDVSQWEFFVVPTIDIDNYKRSQNSITLKSLRAVAGKGISFSDIGGAFRNAVSRQFPDR